MSSDSSSEMMMVMMVGLFVAYEFTPILDPIKESMGLPKTFGIADMLGGVTKVPPSGQTGVGDAAAAGAPISVGGLSTAAQVASTETLTVPASFGGVVILIPNEGHHGATAKECLSGKNCTMLPTKVVAPAGINVVWLSDDAGHDHTINITGGKSSGVIKTDAASPAINFPTAGSFTYKDGSYPGGGTIQIVSGRVSGKATAGAVFCPKGEEAAYTSMINGLGMKVTGSAPSGKVSVIVYTSPFDAAATAAKLAAVTKKTPWT